MTVPHRPSALRRAARAAAVVTGVVLLGGQAAWAVTIARGAATVQDPLAVGAEGAVLDDTAAAPVAGAAAPAAAPARGAAGTAGPQRLRGWAEGLSPRVGVPAVALAAYGAAEVRLAAEDPACHLSWVALAGIGAVESDHGRFRGAALGADGRSDPPVVGIPLDGNGVAAVADSDGGRFDGDAVHDRAVGAMQFIPGTWRRWGADGDGDGVADPFVLPDAALAAGRYLCHAGAGDLRDGAAWRRAVLAYNASSAYVARVTQASNGYAAASRG
ncbi:lytic transglycosylase domain-containing protein [Kineosporia sp. A_224]|uniref:lytic transglycosylase domain-containing protein n=1 Tax=Kineosporia sp. A_224 TaxID=1962180 RepID=UPI00117B698F|nr:lytic transglycosylase domain-containing protein [Kineosporia sp. A_224]